MQAAIPGAEIIASIRFNGRVRDYSVITRRDRRFFLAHDELTFLAPSSGIKIDLPLPRSICCVGESHAFSARTPRSLRHNGHFAPVTSAHCSLFHSVLAFDKRYSYGFNGYKSGCY
jgi:hypothetical protein